jgi:hypothetical protein
VKLGDADLMRATILLLGLLLAGCGIVTPGVYVPSYSAWFIHPDSGERGAVVHWSTAGGGLDQYRAANQYAECKTVFEGQGMRRVSDAEAKAACAQARCYDGIRIKYDAAQWCHDEGLRGRQRDACEKQRVADRVRVTDECAADEYWSGSAGACAPREPQK